MRPPRRSPRFRRRVATRSTSARANASLSSARPSTPRCATSPTAGSKSPRRREAGPSAPSKDFRELGSLRNLGHAGRGTLPASDISVGMRTSRVWVLNCLSCWQLGAGFHSGARFQLQASREVQPRSRGGGILVVGELKGTSSGQGCRDAGNFVDVVLGGLRGETPRESPRNWIVGSIPSPIFPQAQFSHWVNGRFVLQ